MEREKLNKAALDFWDKNDYGFLIKTQSIDAFKGGADWLMQQPLAERLTEEEKEKIIKRYKDELEMARHHTLKMKESVNPTSRQFHANVREGYISRLKLLEQILGKDLFNDK